MMLPDLSFIYQRGGPVSAILIALSVIALTMSLYKLWQFMWERVGWHRSALAAVDTWFSGEHESAYQAVASSRSPLAKVLARAMRGGLEGTNQEVLKEEVTRVALGELIRLRSYLRAIEVIAQTAPLLGLLGTVIGMIQAFSRLEEAGAAVNPAQLAGGIWVALLTTALGLVVAIVFSTIGAWFESRVEKERVIIELTLTGFFAQTSPEAVSG